MDVDIGILGPLTLRVGGLDTPVPRGRQQLVLAHLVVRRGEAVPSDRLADALWGDDPPDDPANALQYVVARLRRLLEPSRPRGADPVLLVTVGDGYRLDVPAAAVDAGRLATAVANAADGEALEAAVDLWRGPPLRDHRDDVLLASEARRLEQLQLTALGRWATAALAAGRHDDVAARLAAVVGEPWASHGEGVVADLVLARHRQGRQAEALAAADRFTARLADELGIDPSPRLRALRDAVLRQDPRLDAPAPVMRPRAVLPTAADRFVRRPALERRLAEGLATHRLVTVVGPAGAGKTRLALEVAAGHDGAVHVPLASVRQVDLLTAFVARSVGLRENTDRPRLDVLAEHLDEAPTVLVLDNAEHLVEAAATLVVDLLRRTTQLRVLVTSQARLGVRGEALVEVGPLPLPRDDDDEVVRASPAVQLFLDRAREHDPTFAADAATRRDVADVVRALDGLPLAIELAAGRARLLSPRELAARLGRALDVLASSDHDREDRHRTLGLALAWSLSLLDDEDRAAFERLAVLADFDLPLAAAVADVADVDQLARLVDRSLVLRLPGGRRFRVLSTVRNHVWASLPADRSRALLGRLVDEVEARVVAATAALRGPRQRSALAELDELAANIHTTLMVLLDRGVGDLDRAQGLLVRCSRWWDWRGEFAEAHEWSRLALARCEEDGVVPQGGLLAWSAFARMELDDAAGAMAQADAAVASGWQDPGTAAPGGHYVRAVLRRRVGDLAGAVADATLVLDRAVAADDLWSQGWANDALAHTVALTADTGRALAYGERSLAAFEALGDERGVAWARNGLADAALAAGRPDEARRHALAALADGAELGDARALAWSCELLAELLSSRRPDDAVRLVGAAARLRGEAVDATLAALDDDRRAAVGGRVAALLDDGRRLARDDDVLALVALAHRDHAAR